MKKIVLHPCLSLMTVFLVLTWACEREEEITPSEKQETRFDLPQGDHDFDTQIVEWAKQYGTNVLYKFSDADLNYQFTSSKSTSYKVTQAPDEEGIRAAVRFLKEEFFDLYPDEVKKKYFPSKILLAGMTYRTGYYEPQWDTLDIDMNFCQLGVMLRGIDHITLPRVDEEFANRISDPVYRKKLRLALNRTFISYLMNPTSQRLAKIPGSTILNTFGSYSLVNPANPGVTDPYSVNNKWYEEDEMYELGFLHYGIYWYFWPPYYWAPCDKMHDFYFFLNFIFSQTKRELQANPLYVNYPPVKKKCDYLIGIFAKQGIDLHCVGGA